eukprot:scaffold222_cov336-Prasinococcus_capsulatus_cf.AAC.5
MRRRTRARGGCPSCSTGPRPRPPRRRRRPPALSCESAWVFVFFAPVSNDPAVVSCASPCGATSLRSGPDRPPALLAATGHRRWRGAGANLRWSPSHRFEQWEIVTKTHTHSLEPQSPYFGGEKSNYTETHTDSVHPRPGRFQVSSPGEQGLGRHERGESFKLGRFFAENMPKE